MQTHREYGVNKKPKYIKVVQLSKLSTQICVISI